ncbi:zinc finger BED domain-containing protein RICESLEEPER 4-like [Nicotiana sylvestris]|uniref:zinc finger BED domain-containing protein RICESLEEPER 4-like n=1 Tax=Nicotiana sylvestris TaxID=4096 RepID=UPI00388CB068
MSISMDNATSNTNDVALFTTTLNPAFSNIFHVRYFLERFHVATNEFSGQYYPTISNCLVYLAEHANLFAYFSEGGEIYEEAIDSMRKKFKKYFFPISPIYGVAALLNPTKKLGGPQYLYQSIYNGLALKDKELSILSDAKASIKINSQTIYSVYQIAIDNARPNIPTPFSSSSQSSKRTAGVRALTTWTEFRGSQGCPTSDCSQLKELEVYLSQGLEEVNPDSSFNLLEWWKDKEKYFPILSRMARDILTIQASTVASKSAVSQARLQLGDYRVSMRESLEKLVLFRDWIRSERRNFGLAESQPEVDEAYEEMLFIQQIRLPLLFFFL